MNFLERLIRSFAEEQREEARLSAPAELGYDGKEKRRRRRRNKVARASRKRNR